MDIDYDKIDKKCPKAFKVFTKYFHKKYGNGALVLPNFCYCDIEAFFDEQGIIIEIIYNWEDNNFWFAIFRNQFMITNYQERFTGSRIKAKEQAIYKAFEILEIFLIIIKKSMIE